MTTRLKIKHHKLLSNFTFNFNNLRRYPQGLMLETMCSSGVDAVLVKVAAMGLMPRRAGLYSDQALD
jgi:hypothetical protein